MAYEVNILRALGHQQADRDTIWKMQDQRLATLESELSDSWRPYRFGMDRNNGWLDFSFILLAMWLSYIKVCKLPHEGALCEILWWTLGRLTLALQTTTHGPEHCYTNSEH